jgi:hypothetical protein
MSQNPELGPDENLPPAIDGEQVVIQEQEAARARALVRGAYVVLALVDLRDGMHKDDLDMSYPSMKFRPTQWSGDPQQKAPEPFGLSRENPDEMQASHALYRGLGLLIGDSASLKPYDYVEEQNPYFRHIRSAFVEAGLYDSDQEAPTPGLASVTPALRGVFWGNGHDIGEVISGVTGGEAFNAAVGEELQLATTLRKGKGKGAIMAFDADDIESRLEDIELVREMPELIPEGDEDATSVANAFDSAYEDLYELPFYRALINDANYAAAAIELGSDLRMLASASGPIEDSARRLNEGEADGR